MFYFHTHNFLSTNKQNVRMKSLECLQVLTALPTPTIVPYREDVRMSFREPFLVLL